MGCKKFAPILFLVVICFKYGASEKNESITGIWKRLFVSKDGSTMSPYSLLMLNQTYNDIPICSQDLQLNDDVNVDFCITPELMNWESNPPDQVAVTHTNQFGEILNIVVFNNSDEYGRTSRESWFNASYIVESTEYFGGLPTSINLHPFERNFVISKEIILYCIVNSMSVKVNISNYIQSRWHHLMRTDAYRNKWYFSASHCYRDVNHTLNIPEEDCLQSGTENCFLCCKLLKKKFAWLKYDNTHYTCFCSEEWPTEMFIDYNDLPRYFEGSCSNTSLGFCYYIHNTKGMFIAEDTVHSYSEDKDNYNINFSYNENRITITFKDRFYIETVCGVSFYSPTLYPEWILQYNASSILDSADYLIPMSYSRKIIAKFKKDVKGKVYTRLDFGPIISEQISIQPANGVNLTKDIKVHAYYTQKNTWNGFSSENILYKHGDFIHAPYLILQGLWNDSYLNTAETLDPYEATDISTIDSRSAYYLTSSETPTELPKTATLEEVLGINDAYSVTQNGQSYQCKCFPEPNITLTVEVMEGIKDAIKSNLTVQTDSLSSTSRKKKSAQDDRSSSKTIGCFGIILLSLEFALLIFLDSTYFIQGIYNLYQKISLARQKNLK